MTETAVIIAERVTFYHQHDEAAFFGWLDSMDVVNGYVGRGTSLHIGLCRSPNDDDLRDLLAIHQRYAIDMRSLAVFKTDANACWFADPGGYWHGAVFGTSTV